MIQVVIIEDNSNYRTALENYIRSETDIEVLFSISSLAELKNATHVKIPDVVILDIGLGKYSGIDFIPDIKVMWPKAGILILTIFEDEEKIIQSIESGATGFLLKSDAPDKIVEAVKKVFRGEGILNGQVARKMFHHISNLGTKRKSVDDFRLTKREKEIVQLLIEGLTYKEITERCFITMSTLNTHILNIYSKMNVHSRAEIAARFRI